MWELGGWRGPLWRPPPPEPLRATQALKVLVGAGGAGGKPSLLSRADAQMMREIFASIGSACGEGSPGLLGAIPAAIRAMQGVPG